MRTVPSITTKGASVALTAKDRAEVAEMIARAVVASGRARVASATAAVDSGPALPDAVPPEIFSELAKFPDLVHLWDVRSLVVQTAQDDAGATYQTVRVAGTRYDRSGREADGLPRFKFPPNSVEYLEEFKRFQGNRTFEAKMEIVYFEKFEKNDQGIEDQGLEAHEIQRMYVRATREGLN